ncbi:hypothetical protein WA158_003818 [Blastocystis sp. Blastoise]
MENISFRQLITASNPIKGFSCGYEKKNNVSNSILITTSAEIYVYSLTRQECVNQWSLGSDFGNIITQPAIQNPSTQMFYVGQNNKTIYSWKFDNDSVSNWNKINISQGLFAIIAHPLLKQFILAITLNGSLFVCESDSIKQKQEIESIETLAYTYQLLKDTTLYISILAKKNENYFIVPYSVTMENDHICITTLPSHPLYTEKNCVPMSISMHPSKNIMCVLYNNGQLYTYTYFYTLDVNNHFDVTLERCLYQFTIDGLINVVNSSKKLKSNTKMTVNISQKVDIIAINDDYVLIPSSATDKNLQLFDLQYGILRSRVSLPSVPSSLYYTPSLHSLLVSYTMNEEEKNNENLNTIGVYLASFQLEPSCLSYAAKTTIDNTMLSDIYPDIICIDKSTQVSELGYYDQEKWEKKLNKEIDHEGEECQQIYKDIMEDKTMTDDIFEQSLLKYLSYQKLKGKKLGNILLSQSFIIKCVNRCIKTDHCLYDSFYALLYTYQVSNVAHPDLLRYLCQHTDLPMVQHAIKFIRDITERELVYILNWLVKDVSMDNINTFLEKIQKLQPNQTEIIKRKLVFYYIFPYIVNKRFNMTLLSEQLSTLSVDIVFFYLQLLTQLLYEVDKPKGRAISTQFLSVSQVFDWILCILDTHLYNIIIQANQNHNYFLILNELETVLDDYSNVGDLAYSVRGILSHIEEKIRLPVSALPIYGIEEIPF